MQDLRGGRYTLMKTLGEGAQGETWEAVDRRQGRLVAIKAFRVGKAKAWKDVELAEREARTLASLSHPLLPRYFEHFEEDGTLYLVMERIEGESLASLRKAGRVFGVADVRRMLDDAAKALTYLHGSAPPIIHRDLKPGNVIRRKDGSFAFVDFGSVRDRLKLEGGSTIVGTFGYMAPEQFQGRASPASDVFGIGATALAMLTGTEPEDLPHKGLAIDVAKAVPAGTPPSLVKALQAMLDPDPDTRAPTIAEALRRAGTSERPPPPSRTSRHAERRSRREERRERKRAKRDAKREAKLARRVKRAPRALLSWTLTAFLAFAVLFMAPLGKWGTIACMVIGAMSVLRAYAAARLAGFFDHEEPRSPDAPGSSAHLRVVTPEEAQEEAIRAAERRDPRDPDEWIEEQARRFEEENDDEEDEKKRRR